MFGLRHGHLEHERRHGQCFAGRRCDHPITTSLFNSFILRLLRVIPRDGARRYLLIDNASFHALDSEVQEEMETVRLGVTHTAPSTCAFDPIEEFFAQCSAYVVRKYGEMASRQGRIVAMTRGQFKDLICEAVDAVGAQDLTAIYGRAGLLAGVAVDGTL
jgi:hypothetical protein